jgi:hypothetical protein
MADTEARPPEAKRAFGTQAEEIAYLVERIFYWEARPRMDRARHFANRLASLLGEESKHSEKQWYHHLWSVIHEARGDFHEAIRCAERVIEGNTTDLATYHDANSAKQNWFREYVITLQDELYLLAGLYSRVGDGYHANQRMIRAHQVAEQYGVPLDETHLERLREFAPEYYASKFTGPIRRGRSAPSQSQDGASSGVQSEVRTGSESDREDLSFLIRRERAVRRPGHLRDSQSDSVN